MNILDTHDGLNHDRHHTGREGVITPFGIDDEAETYSFERI